MDMLLTLRFYLLQSPCWATGTRLVESRVKITNSSVSSLWCVRARVCACVRACVRGS